jgi:hypothetical protein
MELDSQEYFVAIIDEFDRVGLTHHPRHAHGCAIEVRIVCHRIPILARSPGGVSQRIVVLDDNDVLE